MLKQLQEKIGYKFKNENLLNLALIHSSYAYENGKDILDCNERLEFLGDAILEAVSSEFLYGAYPEKTEGELSRMRAALVCEESLAVCAKEIELGKYLYLGNGEDKNGGRKRASVTSDAFEAVIGAIFLDGGFTNAKDFIVRYVLNDIENKTLFYDSKTILQEITQRDFKCAPTYRLIEESGPDHKKNFKVVTIINDIEYEEGAGSSKKSAEQLAAYHTLLKLKDKSR